MFGDPMSTLPTPLPVQGRRPIQKRSIERVARLLDAAAALIGEECADGLKMGAVARRAGVPIGSLYQYFPDKSALIHGLADRYFESGRQCIADALAGVGTMDDLAQAFGDLVDEYLAIFQEDPAMAHVRAGVLADPCLAALELEDVRANGTLLADALARVKPAADPARLGRTAFLLMHCGESTMRLALSLPAGEAAASVEAYKDMAIAEMRRL